MSDSEDSDLEEGPDVVRHTTQIVCQSQMPYIHVKPPDVIYERWAKIKPELKKQVGHMMHIHVFWWHILLRQQDHHSTTIWAVQMGFLDPNVFNDLSLKRLKKIEVLESILQAMEMGLSHREMERKASAVISINLSFTMHKRCLSDAVNWLVDSGAPHIREKLQELGSPDIRYHTLRFVFDEYARYLQVMSCSKKKAMEELNSDPDPWSLSKSEEMKNKGNEQFQKKKYDLAIKWYTKAIKYHPNNHILYGNRALCFIRSEKYMKALGDGKRAVILQPDWAKGHYRFCDALFYLGEHQKALEANRLAQSACRSDVEGYKDLLQQCERFQTELQESKAEVKPKKMESKKSSSKARAHVADDSTSQPVRSSRLCEAVSDSVLQSENQQRLHESSGSFGAPLEDRSDTHKDFKSEMTPRKSKKTTLNTPEKPTVRSKHPATPERFSSVKPQEIASDAEMRERFCAAVQEGHEALKDQRWRNAHQSFSLAVRMLDSSVVTDLDLSELDKCVLIYGYATALLEIGQPEELAEARRLLTKLESSERKFQSLVHYGMGRVYLKENRFAKALDHFSNALLITQRNITPGKLTWPTTKAILEETQADCLQEHLENFVEMCKFPPKPDAVCCHPHCLAHTIKIYFSDPDFRGYIQLICCQMCRVEFHMICWKKLKSLSFTDKSDKDFLKDPCFTPDCEGQICHIVIFGSTGLIKCEFETPIPKIKLTGRLRVRQQCTSIKKLKSKSERKLRRKQHRQAAHVAHQENKEVSDVPAHRVTPKHSVIVDPVLHQIHENKELFKEESVNISCVLDHLRPWLDLCESKGHECVLNRYREDLLLSELVDLLLESSNRVWARVFIETLCSWLHIKPRLQQWAQQLDNAGLKAAETFISRYSSHLQQLDLKPLLAFTPLQNALVETFGPTEELFDRGGFTLMEYVRQAPAKDLRLFIWTLESRREQYQSCHFILDQYFEDDAVCLVIKKTDDDENISTVFKSKNRHRKKKQKDSKSVIVLSGIRGGHSRDEDDDLFSEEDPFLFLSGGDPFSIPDHLRSQLTEFEEQYAGSAHRSRYERILDNNTDPTKESLYDYFAQILEEHGPLRASDPLMVGELENFPMEAQQRIATAGGLEAFLLESLRFVMTDDVIGLMKHMVSLTDPPHLRQMSHLNPSAKEFWPQTDVLTDSVSHVEMVSFDNSAELLSMTADSILLPDPYALQGLVTDYQHSPADITVDAAVRAEALQLYESVGEHASAQFCGSAFESSLYISECSAGERTEENQSSQQTAVSVQASDEKKDVSINTEPFSPFESNNGDVIQKEKQMLCLSEELKQMKEDVHTVQQKRKEQISSLQEELENITHKTQIACAELGLFQQKLEDEVKKDQQEKRENQETLKMLKMDIKDLTDVHESFSRDILDRNKEYQADLDRFLKASNQCAAERMTLEDEIKRQRDTCVRDQRRSLTAQLSVLLSRRDHGLKHLRARLFEGKMVVKHMTEASHSFSSTVLLSAMDEWKRCICDIEEKINNAVMEFESQMNEVKKGTRLCSLPPVSVPSPPAAPPMVPAAFQQPASHYTHLHEPHGSLRPGSLRPTRTPTPTGRSTPQPADRRPEEPLPLASTQQHLSVYDRMMERLNMMFPHYNRLVLNKFIQEVRLVNGGALSTLTYDDVVNRVAQLILDHQENSWEHMNVGDVRELVAQSLTDSSGRTTGTPPLTHVWKKVSEKHCGAALALNTEDPCIICHEDMSAEDVCVLECRHSFHGQCIKSWLKEQSTCPTCRKHALLPEDFPVLPGRHRKSHVPAATFN